MVASTGERGKAGGGRLGAHEAGVRREGWDEKHDVERPRPGCLQRKLVGPRRARGTRDHIGRISSHFPLPRPIGSHPLPEMRADLAPRRARLGGAALPVSQPLFFSQLAPPLLPVHICRRLRPRRARLLMPSP